MKIWVALAGWVGAVLRFVPVEFDVLRFWNSVRFAPALQAPAIFTLCLCGFWARVAGWRSWAVYSTLDPSTTGCIQNVLDWVSRLSDWVWVGGFGVGFQVMALGFNVLGQWFGVQGPGFVVLGLGFTVLGTGFEGLGLGFDVGGCLRLLGLGFPNSRRSLEPQPQIGPGLNVSSQNARTLVPTHSRRAPNY